MELQFVSFLLVAIKNSLTPSLIRGDKLKKLQEANNRALFFPGFKSKFQTLPFLGHFR